MEYKFILYKWIICYSFLIMIFNIITYFIIIDKPILIFFRKLIWFTIIMILHTLGHYEQIHWKRKMWLFTLGSQTSINIDVKYMMPVFLSGRSNSTSLFKIISDISFFFLNNDCSIFGNTDRMFCVTLLGVMYNERLGDPSIQCY